MTSEPAITKRPALRLSSSGIEQLPAIKIKRDGGTQSRAETSPEHVERLVEAIKEGTELPPIVVFFDGEKYWLADGFHRVEAHTRIAGYEAVIPAEIRQGDRRAAVLYSVGANQSHGLPRSREDTRRAIETLLRDEEWGKWSDREIARQVGCSHATVGTVRTKLAASGQIDQIENRTVARNGTVYTQQPARPPRCYDCGQNDPDKLIEVGGPVKILCRMCQTRRVPVTHGLSQTAIDRGYAYQLNGADVRVSKSGMFVCWVSYKGERHDGIGSQEHLDQAIAEIEERVRLELAPLPVLRIGFRWVSSGKGVWQVERIVNGLRTRNLYQHQLVEGAAWSQAQAEQPITWGHAPTVTLEQRIERLKNSLDPQAEAALAELLGGTTDADDGHDGEAEDDEEDPDTVTVEVPKGGMTAYTAPSPTCIDCGETSEPADGVMYTGRCEGCYFRHCLITNTERDLLYKTFNGESAIKFYNRYPGKTGARAVLAEGVRAQLAALVPAAPPPSDDGEDDDDDPIDRDSVLYAAREHFESWLDTLSDRELKLLALAVWQNAMLDWYEADRQQLIGGIASNLVEGVGYDIDAGWGNTRIKRVIALLTAK